LLLLLLGCTLLRSSSLLSELLLSELRRRALSELLGWETLLGKLLWGEAEGTRWHSGHEGVSTGNDGLAGEEGGAREGSSDLSRWEAHWEGLLWEGEAREA
jgi:hypothetical protein